MNCAVAGSRPGGCPPLRLQRVEAGSAPLASSPTHNTAQHAAGMCAAEMEAAPSPQLAPPSSPGEEGCQPSEDAKQTRRWTQAEHAKLLELVERYGSKRWADVANGLPGRTAKQCRERFINHGDGNDTRRGAWTPDEELALCIQHGIHGTRWRRVAPAVGRRDSDIKNRWYSTQRCKAIHNHSSLLWVYMQQLKAGNEPHAALRTALLIWEQHVSRAILERVVGFVPSEQPDRPLPEQRRHSRSPGRSSSPTSPNNRDAPALGADASAPPAKRARTSRSETTVSEEDGGSDMAQTQQQQELPQQQQQLGFARQPTQAVLLGAGYCSGNGLLLPARTEHPCSSSATLTVEVPSASSVDAGQQHAMPVFQRAVDVASLAMYSGQATGNTSLAAAVTVPMPMQHSLSEAVSCPNISTNSMVLLMGDRTRCTVTHAMPAMPSVESRWDLTAAAGPYAPAVASATRFMAAPGIGPQLRTVHVFPEGATLLTHQPAAPAPVYVTTPGAHHAAASTMVWQLPTGYVLQPIMR